MLILLHVCLLASASIPVRADSTEFFNDDSLVLLATDAALEAPVLIFHNGTLLGGHNHKVVEAFDRVPGTGSFPRVFVDLHANTFLRNTYQKSGGGGASLGTSDVGSASFRTTAGLQFIPTVTRGDVNATGFFGRYFSQIVGNFGSQVSLTTTHSFPGPIVCNPNKGQSRTKMLGLPTDWSQTLTLQRWRLHAQLAQHFFACPNCNQRALKLFLPLCTEEELRDALTAQLWLDANNKRIARSSTLRPQASRLIARYGPLFPPRRLLCRKCLHLRYGQVRTPT